MDEITQVLTDERIAELWVESRAALPRYATFARAIERAVREADMQATPFAHVANKHGDPKAFAERELRFDDAVLQKLPIGAKLYVLPPSPEAIDAEKL